MTDFILRFFKCVIWVTGGTTVSWLKEEGVRMGFKCFRRIRMKWERAGWGEEKGKQPKTKSNISQFTFHLFTHVVPKLCDFLLNSFCPCNENITGPLYFHCKNKSSWHFSKRPFWVDFHFKTHSWSYCACYSKEIYSVFVFVIVHPTFLSHWSSCFARKYIKLPM